MNDSRPAPIPAEGALARLAQDLAWERRARDLLQTIALAASEAPTVEAAFETALGAVCRHTGWPVGHVYLVAADGSGDLVPSGLWHLDDPARFETFRRVTEATRIPVGCGLPGRILAARRPAWIPDIAEDLNFPRQGVAGDLEVRAGFGLPVMCGTAVYAVLEFFSSEREQPDGPMLDVMANMGIQLGRVVERKAAELALRESEQRFRSVAESATDAIISADSDGTIVSWNRGAELVFGYPAPDAVGKPLTLVIPERYREAHRAGLERLKAGGEPRVLGRTVELSGLRRSGEEFPIELSLATWRSGDAVFYSGIIRDITERQVALERLRTVAARLEASEREAQRVKEEALALERAAREASLAKSTFLASMSHELRTPLHGVIGMVDLLLDTALDARQLRYAQVARSSANLLLGVMNGILDFSKVESGRLELEEVLFVPCEVLDDVAAVLGHSAGEKKLELALVIDPGLSAAVLGDAGRLRQVLLNLASNAIKFTERGSVTIRGSRVEPAGDGEDGSFVRLRFEVTDTGIGIPEDRLARLFVPFSQVDASTARRYGGTGLGLAISKQLVELMGGAMRVESRPGAGSTFSFTVRFAAMERAPLAVARKGPAAGTGRPPPVQERGRVLVVEDNAINQEVVAGILDRATIAFDLVGSGRSALDAIAARTYALVLMDCHLPDMDGFETTRRIRQLEREVSGIAGARPGRRLPIVAATASATKGDRERCIDAGMDDYIVKPFDAGRIVDLIERYTAADPGAGGDASGIGGDRIRGGGAGSDAGTGSAGAAAPADEVAPAAPAVPAAGAPPPIDEAALVRVCCGDAAFARRILAKLGDRLIPSVERIETVLALKDARATADVAHQLRGSAANAGAFRLRDLAAEAEQAARAGDLERAARAVPAIAAEAERCRRFIDLRGAAPGPANRAGGES